MPAPPLATRNPPRGLARPARCTRGDALAAFAAGSEDTKAGLDLTIRFGLDLAGFRRSDPVRVARRRLAPAPRPAHRAGARSRGGGMSGKRSPKREMPGCHPYEDWQLTPEGAAIHPGEKTAVIADVHLGYEWARGLAGDCVPAHSLAETLE